MEKVRESYGAVFQVIAEADVSGYATPGLPGRLCNTIDALKTLGAAGEQWRTAPVLQS
jgi:hypothetical protein